MKLFEDFDLNSDLQILDMGSGAGKMLKLLQEQGVDPSRITALDENPKLLGWCRQAWPTVKYVEGDCAKAGGNPALKSSTFDVVTAHMLLSLLPDQAFSETINSAHQLLKPGGVFVFLVPSSRGKSEKYGIDSENRETILFWEQTKWGITPYYLRPEVMMRRKLAKSGFGQIEVENFSYNSFPDNTTHLIQALGIDGNAYKRLVVVAKK